MLYSMLEELENYHRDRSYVFEEAVKKRLGESFKNYYDSVMKTVNRLEYANELRLLKKLNKM